MRGKIMKTFLKTKQLNIIIKGQNEETNKTNEDGTHTSGEESIKKTSVIKGRRSRFGREN